MALQVYAYTDDSKVYSMEYGDDLGSIVYYRYDDTGKVSTMLDGDWTPIRYFYYEDGQLIYLENGYGSGNGISRQEFTYDGLGRLSGVVYKNEAGAVQEQYTITYNEAGKITREDISTNYNALPMSTVKEYAYDALGRLIQEKIDGVITAYTYDAVGNRLSESSGGNTKTYAYDAYDCLTSISTNGTIAASYSYDVSGNQVSRTQGTVTTDYAYDAANHLTQVREGGSVVASYEYDAAGQRTKKSVDGETVNYYYDGIDLLYTEDGSGQTIDVNILEEDGSLIATMQGSDMWWYRQDIRGSITNVVDSEGNLGKSYIYSAYGSTQSEGTFTGSFAYTGALLDEETGLCYMNARYYDSETGRFISEDTYRGDGEEYWHLYAYCEGDPVNYTDPTGHAVISLIAIGTLAILGYSIFLWGDYMINGNNSILGRMSNSLIAASVAVRSAVSTALAKARTRADRYRKNELHHIVAQGAWGAQPSRNVLKDAGMTTQHPSNLIWLKYGLHRHLHTWAYYSAVNNVMNRAKYGSSQIPFRARVEMALRAIRTVLSSANALV